ncbi:Fungalysin/Thermolysin Extracellular metalloproteinase 5 [Dinochytrium kinnereticum]|nr:Fungalysin/Thermolysin Extracellular metalloproteinase 5 [Dinochytrium kinnereticum]
MLSPIRLILLAASLYATIASAHPLLEPRAKKGAGKAANLSSSSPLNRNPNPPSAVAKFWMPRSNFLRPAGVKPKSGSVSMTVAEEAGLAYLRNQWNLKKGDYEMATCYQDKENGVTHLSVVQMLNGLPIVNGVANINIDGSGQVISASGSIAPSSLTSSVTGGVAAANKPTGRGKKQKRASGEISALDAVNSIAKAMKLNAGSKLTMEADPAKKNGFLVKGAAFQAQGSPIPASLAYYQTSSGGLEKVYDVVIQTEKDWQNVFVSTTTGQVLGASSWVSNSLFGDLGFKSPIEKRSPSSPSHNGSHKQLARRQAGDATYDVVPFGLADITENGGRQSTIVNPADPVASQSGWHDLGNGQGALSTTTGNNVVATSNFQNAANPLRNAPVAVSNFQFDAQFNGNVDPTPNSEVSEAGVTNMFFVSNMFHDVMFHYGFDEGAGNFQLKNFGANGRAGDPVVATAQDGSGFNNANFATPPDGQAGRMRMFLFNTLSPIRDGAMENDIIIHELAHGVSNRLTGGPADSNCLQDAEAGGMGEGWSDFFGVVMQMKAGDTRNTDKAVGVFVTGSETGVRNFAYSTSLQRNPHTYSTLGEINLQDVHGVGEVWNAMLYEVYWNLVDKKGFAPVDQLIGNFNSGRGNVDMIRLVVEGMKLQPCNPTFMEARDAILQADLVTFNGANQCDIWRGFAKRGLGFSALDNQQFVNAFDVDPACN